MIVKADPEHLANIEKGVEFWNQWMRQNPSLRANFRDARMDGVNLAGFDLRGADLQGAFLRGANLRGASLRNAMLTRTNLTDADLSEADLLSAHLRGAILTRANLYHAHMPYSDLQMADFTDVDLRRANITNSDLYAAKFCGANLAGANLSLSSLVRTKLDNANLTDCGVYGVSAWDVTLEGAIQSNLVISPSNEAAIQVDSLEVAQFIYLLLNNKKIRQVIDTIGKKAVLILGRFTAERKAILDAIREALRNNGYLPILFDFDIPGVRDTQETITTLAGMARFIIADITDAKSITQELAVIVPSLPSVPVQPLLQIGDQEWGMYDHIKRFPWVLPVVRYENQETLLAGLNEQVIVPAEAMAVEQTRK